MMRWILAGVVVIGLAACDGGHGRQLTYREMDQIARRTTDEQVHRNAPDTCLMAQHANLVGAVGAEIDRATLPAGARVICHNCAVTMDYRAERLNVDLGADGRVTGLHCG